MKYFLILVTILFSTPSFALNDYYYQNTLKGCGVVIGKENNDISSPYFIAQYNHDGLVQKDSGHPNIIARSPHYDKFSLYTTNDATIELSTQKGNIEQFELYQTQNTWFSRVRTVTYCNNMNLVKPEFFIFY